MKHLIWLSVLLALALSFQSCSKSVATQTSPAPEMVSLEYIYPKDPRISYNYDFYDDLRKEFIPSPILLENHPPSKPLPGLYPYTDPILIEVLFKEPIPNGPNTLFQFTTSSPLLAYSSSVVYVKDSINYRWTSIQFQLLTHPSSSTIGIETLVLDWKAQQKGSTRYSPILSTTHRIYKTFRPALAPMHHPNWISVLDSACLWAAGSSNEIEAASRIMGKMVKSFRHEYSSGPDLALEFPENCNPNGVSAAGVDLDRYLQEGRNQKKQRVDCFVSSYLMVLFLRSIGIEAEAVQVGTTRSPSFCTNPHLQVGCRDFAQDNCHLSKWFRGDYSRHALVKIKDSLYFDPTIEIPRTFAPDCPLVISAYTLDDYIQTVQTQKKGKECLPEHPSAYKVKEINLSSYHGYTWNGPGPQANYSPDSFSVRIKGKRYAADLALNPTGPANFHVAVNQYSGYPHEAEIFFDIYQLKKKESIHKQVQQLLDNGSLAFRDTTFYYRPLNSRQMKKLKGWYVQSGCENLLIYSQERIAFVAHIQANVTDSIQVIPIFSDTLSRILRQPFYGIQGSPDHRWNLGPADTLKLGEKILVSLDLDSSGHKDLELCKAYYSVDHGNLIPVGENKLWFIATHPGDVQFCAGVQPCCNRENCIAPRNQIRANLYVAE